MNLIIVGLLVITILKFGVNLFYDHLTGYAGAIVQHEMRTALMEKLSNLPYQYLLSKKQGELAYTTLLAPAKAATIILRARSAAVRLSSALIQFRSSGFAHPGSLMHVFSIADWRMQ